MTPIDADIDSPTDEEVSVIQVSHSPDPSFDPIAR